MKVTLFSALAAIAPIASLAAPIVARQDNGTSNATAPVSSSDGPVGFASLNGGTTGGAGGAETTVTSIEDLIEAVKGDEAAIIYVEGTLEGSTEKIRVGSNKSILGKNSESHIIGAGLFIKEAKNVIVQNLAISKVSEGEGDAIGVQVSENIWLDHLDLSSDVDHGKDYYDALADFTHGSDYITVSNTLFHDHYKASLAGHSDSNGDEDTGKLHVTYINNVFRNINSRMPLVRFGTAHVVNNYYDGETLGDSGANIRMGAQALVEGNKFIGIKDPISSQYSKEEGYVVAKDNDLGDGENTAAEGTLTEVPYEYTLLAPDAVEAAVASAGNTLTLG